MKARWHMLVPVLALGFQVLPPLLLLFLAWAAYAARWGWLQPCERPASLLVLGCSAVVSLLLGSFGTYGLLTRARLRTAVVLIVACCLPVLFAGAMYLHGLLIFLGWV